MAIVNTEVIFRNKDKPFAELFNFLRRYEYTREGETTLVYSIEELKLMYAHISNAVQELLDGIQELMDFFCTSRENDRTKFHDYKVWPFLSMVVNLIEALDNFRLDVDYDLRQRGVVDY